MSNDAWDICNVYTAKHENETLRVGHDFFLRWYVVLDRKWRTVEEGTSRNRALEAAHALFHYVRDEEGCGKELNWELDSATRAQVLGECPKCLNPNLDSDLKRYRACPDCGWRIDFTPDQIKWLEEKLNRKL